MFVFSYQNEMTEEKTMFLYVEMLHNEAIINHHLIVNTQKGYKESVDSIDYITYEGDWMMCFYFVDQNEIKIYYYSATMDRYYSSSIQGSIQQSSVMVSITGGYMNLQIDKEIYLQSFTGLILSVFTTELNIFDNFQILKYCDTSPLCYQFSLNLVNYNYLMTGSNILHTQTFQKLAKNRYLIQGWIKQDSLQFKSQQDSLLLRVTINQQYFDNLQIGDRDLYILYHQNEIQIAQNGFSLQTYSYIFPYKPSTYTSQPSEIVTVLNKKYKQSLIEWHYFKYEFGTTTNAQQPIYRVYFPSIDSYEEFNWGKQINHFTNTYLFFHIGGDDYYLNPFKGRLSDWKFQYFCDLEGPEFQIKCDYTCLTCKGVSANDCLTCHPESNRIYSSDQNTCECKYGYIDVENELTCQLMEQFHGELTLQEGEIQCNKEGYYQCDDIVLCEWGYFMYQNVCLKCPHFDSDGKETVIQCADCYLHPEIFVQNLNCLRQLVSSTENDVYFFTVGFYSDQEVFKIVQTDVMNYELQLMRGMYEGYFCKDGFYKNSEGNCLTCVDNCQFCLNANTCTECIIGYYQREDGICVPCQMCYACMYKSGQEYCHYEDDCEDQKYWMNDQCYNCGNFCSKCNYERCFYCIDQQQYYITLDGVNCARCTIPHCIQCFQYIRTSHGTLLTTLDSNQQKQELNYEMKTGCALCEDNYFFSYVTLNCEPSIAEDCQFGVTDDIKVVCLKSDTLQDAVQSTFCNSQFCQSCLNYSNQSVQSFCIICMDGYYSFILTGQCKQCPSNCKTCVQQNQGYQDYWKWSIRSFYEVFVNTDGNHPFQTYAMILGNNFEIICLSCSGNMILYKNVCHNGCNDQCLDCKIDLYYNTYSALCYKCKSTSYNLQRSIDPDNPQTCLECPDFCSGCFIRQSSEISAINPFFNQTSPYQKYTTICFRKQSKFNEAGLNIIPKHLAAIKCSQYQRCQKTLTVQYYAYCETTDMYDDLFAETEFNFRPRYTSAYSIFVMSYTTWFEDSQTYEYLNRLRISEANYELEFRGIRRYESSCFIEPTFNKLLINYLKENVFTIRKVNVHIFSIEEKKIPIYFYTNNVIANFESIRFSRVLFRIPTPYRSWESGVSEDNIYAYIKFTNDHYSISVMFESCEIVQLYPTKVAKFTFLSSCLNQLTIHDMLFIKLGIKNSVFFDLQPKSDTQSIQNTTNLIIQDCQFTNTSIFYYAALQNSLNQKVYLSNVTIMNSYFNSSYFINSSFQSDFEIGSIILENFYVENTVLENGSVFIHLLSTSSLIIRNFTLKNLQILDQSCFFVGNTMEISDFSIINSFINSGYFITNIGDYSQSLNVLKSANIISLQDISITNTTYSSANSFIFIVQQQVNNLTLILNGLTLSNNNYTSSQIGKYAYSYVSYKSTLIYIECTYCQFSNVQIYRGVGSPEITILNSKQLVISNLLVQLSQQYYLRSLHSSVECIKQLIYLDIPFVLYIGSYTNVVLENVIIQESIVVDYSLILFVGKNQMEGIQQNSITIANSNFQNNLLLITMTNRFSSIISINTEQDTDINITNIKFLNNHMNQYSQDVQLHSSATLLIEAQLGNITIEDSDFIQNVITNSSEAILYIKAQTLLINDCRFSNQNILNTKVLVKNIILQDDQKYINEDVYSIFQILSQGGNGHFFVSTLRIQNSQVANSIAVNGGAFYIETQTIGLIEIENSAFQNTTTVLNGYQLSSGGLIYIDASKSRLSLTIYNSTIFQSYSRTFGGVIFIEPSRLENLIIFNYLNIESAFSLQHSILSYSPSKLITVASNLNINNSIFSNNQSEFEHFISKITDLSQQNIYPFQQENPLIYIQFSNFTMLNCTFQSIHLASIMQIYSGIIINLIQIQILNSSVFLQPFISISLREGIFIIQLDLEGYIRIEKSKLINIDEFLFEKNFDCIPQYTSSKSLLCPRELSQINLSPQSQSIDKNLTAQQYCNLNSLYTATNYNFSLIQLVNMKSYHYITITDLHISHVKCSACYYGLLSIQNFDVKELNFKYDNIRFFNNVCGVIGCFSILQSLKDQIFLTIAGNQVVQNNDISFDANDQDSFEAILKNSVFINNTATYGGSCFFTNIDLLINNSYFANNYASSEGGAIYYYSDVKHIQIQNSEIVQNNANIAGGIFMNEIQLEKAYEMNLFLKDNLATEFANNIFEAPRKLYVSLKSGQRLLNKNLISNSTTIIDNVIVDPYQVFGQIDKTQILLLPSGIGVSKYRYFDPVENSYIKYNLSLRILATNVFDEQIINLENTQCNINAQVLNKSQKSQDIVINKDNSSQYLSTTQIKFNLTSGDYNLDDMMIYFNPLTHEDLFLQIAFQCNSVLIPYYNASQIQNIIKDYILLLNLRTFQCQLGEYLNTTSGGCVLCDTSQNQYSVSINSSVCSYKDELKMKNIEPAMIQLRETYWRAFYYSETIESCYHLTANCQGGWFAGDPSCIEGHIGALCEQCDLYDIRGYGSFSQNQYYQCSGCNQKGTNIINIFFVICWTLLSVFITVTSTIQMIEDFVYQLKLKPFGFFTIVKSASTSVLLKVLTNYLQIISSIASFQLHIPIGITLTVRGLGNPIESMAFSLDCFLIELTSISIIYFRVIWGFLMAGIYISLFFSLHLLLSMIKKTKLNITFITTTLVYIYIYLSPNLVSGLIALISYRTISGEKWVAANVAYLYETNKHEKWLIFFVAPALLIVSLLLPFFFWFILYHHRDKLNTTKVRKVWGYLYNEYKLQTYYWETIKIIQKELIILVMIYYEDYVAIKAALIFFILHLYNKIAIQYKPYLTGDLNNIDYLSTSICKISIILASSIYTAQQLNMIEIVWPFYAVLAVINFFFITEMISKLLFAYFDKLYEQIDKVKAAISYRFPALIKGNKLCFRVFQNTTERKQLIRKRFQLIRIYLLQQAKMILTFKELNNMDMPCSIKTQKESVQTVVNPLSTSHRMSARLLRAGTNIHTQKPSKYFTTQLTVETQKWKATNE